MKESRCISPRRGSRISRGSAFASMIVAAVAIAAPARAQATAPAALPTPNVGDVAPDFTLTGATRYGILRDPVRLSALRGQTVVLAFFPKARTKG